MGIAAQASAAPLSLLPDKVLLKPLDRLVVRLVTGSLHESMPRARDGNEPCVDPLTLERPVHGLTLKNPDNVVGVPMDDQCRRVIGRDVTNR